MALGENRIAKMHLPPLTELEFLSIYSIKWAPMQGVVMHNRPLYLRPQGDARQAVKTG